MDVALSSMTDPRGIRAALVGVDVVVHLAGTEILQPGKTDLATHIQGTRNLAQAAAEAGVRRFIHLSQIGANRTSAFDVLRAVARAEGHVEASGIPFDILRVSVLYGKDDVFTTGLAMLMSISPGLFFLPGEGDRLLQPLWSEDLATCIQWMLEDEAAAQQAIEIGGPEYFSLRQILELVRAELGWRGIMVAARQPYLRAIGALAEWLLPAPPLVRHWLDYLSQNRISSLDTLPRRFGLQPARMGGRLEYLRDVNWGLRFVRRQFQARSGQL
jgi:NADH dehydrogenase